MRATTTFDVAAVPGFTQAARQWLGATRLVAAAAGRAAGKALYRITKARILLEHDPGRPARRL